jgi:alkanesulfonate monooxygenase SsuD/methylene tetrahydromethanopterin reductase-like flavin-dependent oxidoreductase (luciferase family)
LRGPPSGSRPPPRSLGGLGGVGAGGQELAGRLADAWNGWARTPEELAAGLAAVRRAAERAGRDPAGVAGTWGGQLLVAPEPPEAEARLARWGAGRPPGEAARVVAGDPETVTARLRALADAGAAWCVVAFVGGPAAEMRALLADAVGLGGRGRMVERETNSDASEKAPGIGGRRHGEQETWSSYRTDQDTSGFFP